MVTKIYKLAQPKNSATFNVVGKSGNTVGYVFKDGNQINQSPARCVLRDKYYQDLLESTPMFKNGIIRLERKFGDEEVKKTDNKPKYIEVPEVNSDEKAISYVANTWAVQVKTGKLARRFANKKGYDFPNLED